MTTRHAYLAQPRALVAALAVVGALALATIFAPAAGASHGRHGGVHLRKTRHGQVVATSNNMQYNGGPVMLASQTYAIFWEPAKLQDGTATHVSATYNSLIQRYFGAMGGPGLYNNNTQYYQTTSGAQQNIQNSSTFGAAYVDTSAYPASDCVDVNTPGDCISDAAIQAEVSKVKASQGWIGGLRTWSSSSRPTAKARA